jgi:hypothetical protein
MKQYLTFRGWASSPTKGKKTSSKGFEWLNQESSFANIMHKTSDENS